MVSLQEAELNSIRVDGGSNVEKPERLAKPKHSSEDSKHQICQDDTNNNKHVDPLLYIAAFEGHIENFKSRLEVQGTDFNLEGPSGNSLLHAAASSGSQKMAEIIISEEKSLLTRVNKKCETPLHVATRAKQVSLVDFLISKKDEKLMKMQDINGNTALHLALLDNNPCKDIVKKLFNADQKVQTIKNIQGKSPLYIAAEIGDREILGIMIKALNFEDGSTIKELEGSSPVYAAIQRKDNGLLEYLLEIESKGKLIQVKNEPYRSPLSYAAYEGYTEGVKLLSKFSHSAFDRARQSDGNLPIHSACSQGHIEVVKELLKGWPDATELVNGNNQNILHIAALNGKDQLVKYIIKNPKFEGLLNEKDSAGNTPLHLATRNEHPKVLLCLTWDERIKINETNHEGLTALELAYTLRDRPRTLRQLLMWWILKSGRAKFNRDPVCVKRKKTYSSREKPHIDWIKDRINTLLLVATLVATVTFAAGFTMPGGYNDSKPKEGAAILVNRLFFKIFVICNTMAMYLSILVDIILLRAQFGVDFHLVYSTSKFAVPFLGASLVFMSLAFMAGTSLVVSEVTWLASFVMVMGILYFSIISTVFIDLHLHPANSSPIIRRLKYITFFFLISMAGCSAPLPDRNTSKQEGTTRPREARATGQNNGKDVACKNTPSPSVTSQ